MTTFNFFSSYLFYLNEINNDGIVAVLWQWHWTTLFEIKNTATNTLFLVGLTLLKHCFQTILLLSNYVVKMFPSWGTAFCNDLGT